MRGRVEEREKDERVKEGGGMGGAMEQGRK